jgi:F-type H+-transporting ATPase subunit delta
MTPGAVARRYAKALYELVAERGDQEETGAALRQVAEAVSALDPSLLAPGVLPREARETLGRALAKPFGTDSTFGKFLALVSVRDRLGELPGVAHFYTRMQDEAAGRVRLEITMASDPAPAEVDNICQAFRKLAGREVLPELRADPAILGGAVVELEGRVYDGSVRTQLARLTEQASGRSDLV